MLIALKSFNIYKKSLLDSLQAAGNSLTPTHAVYRYLGKKKPTINGRLKRVSRYEKNN